MHPNSVLKLTVTGYAACLVVVRCVRYLKLVGRPLLPREGFGGLLVDVKFDVIRCIARRSWRVIDDNAGSSYSRLR